MIPCATNNNHLVIFIITLHPTTIDTLTYCPGAFPDRLTDCYNAAETLGRDSDFGQYAVPITLPARYLIPFRGKAKETFLLYRDAIRLFASFFLTLDTAQRRAIARH